MGVRIQSRARQPVMNAGEDLPGVQFEVTVWQARLPTSDTVRQSPSYLAVIEHESGVPHKSAHTSLHCPVLSGETGRKQVKICPPASVTRITCRHICHARLGSEPAGRRRCARASSREHCPYFVRKLRTKYGHTVA